MSSSDPLHFLTPSNIKLPTSKNRISNFNPTTIASDARSTAVILHPRIPSLFLSFLTHKRNHGSQYEKSLYGTPETYTWEHLTIRLITKRPLAFLMSSDHTVLRDGKVLFDSCNEWDRNGTEQQHLNRTLTLENYLSYDEIMLSSLIGASGPTYFINTGSRNNRGRVYPAVKHQERGIIVGLVGARFEREDRMDSIHILPPVENPKQDPQLTAIFSDFFGGRSKESRAYFDAEMYKARMQITAETLLLEANDRASKAGKTAFIHVVGLGLGVWQIDVSQPNLYISVFTAALQALALPHVSTITFSWIDVSPTIRESCIATGAAVNISIRFNRRDPAEPLESDELLVVSYAWDGNAFPGNEYWMGSLSASGDPAAACFSTIPELHNPLVNPYAENIKVLPDDRRK